jgi:hypothetical protein
MFFHKSLGMPTDFVLAEIVEEECESCKQNKEYPSIIQQVGNLAEAGIDWVKSGFEMASEDLRNHRKSICESCEWKDHQQQRCIKCACYIEYATSIAAKKCPLSKW